MKLTAIVITLFLMLSCSGKQKPQKKDVPVPETNTKVKPVENSGKKETPVKGSFPLVQDYETLRITRDISNIQKGIESRIRLLSTIEQQSLMRAMVAEFRKKDEESRIAAVRMLSMLPVPEDWIDTVNEWIISEKSAKVRPWLFQLLRKFKGERVETLFSSIMQSEKDWESFKASAQAAQGYDPQTGLILKKAFPHLNGFKKRYLLVLMKNLPSSPDLLTLLRNCTASSKVSRCWVNLSTYGEKEDYENLVKILESTQSPDPWALGSVLNWSKKEFFEKDRVVKILFKTISNPQFDLLARKVAAGEIGKIGDREDLQKLINTKFEKSLSENIEKAKWRIRRRLGLPAVLRIQDIGKTQKEDSKKKNNN
ncbi:hypothetical protein KKF34_08595 [Myxococcota bacterium]|nr:hypothetical protein [Myxococcota bacterium]MBU1382923.1 hypothetical protein [Myxococcota bacterium]MBU1496922.1 hypothetical protein [Myxococcota bacterium]